jgi:hypothetical protein
MVRARVRKRPTIRPEVVVPAVRLRVSCGAAADLRSQPGQHLRDGRPVRVVRRLALPHARLERLKTLGLDNDGRECLVRHAALPLALDRP